MLRWLKRAFQKKGPNGMTEQVVRDVLMNILTQMVYMESKKPSDKTVNDFLKPFTIEGKVSK